MPLKAYSINLYSEFSGRFFVIFLLFQTPSQLSQYLFEESKTKVFSVHLRKKMKDGGGSKRDLWFKLLHYTTKF